MSEELHHEPEYSNLPIPVRVEAMPTQERAVVYGSYTTVVVSAAAGFAAQLVGQDRRRYRVLVWSDGKVLIGQQNEVTAGKGATLGAGLNPVEIRNQQELWVATTGVVANVSVIAERMG